MKRFLHNNRHAVCAVVVMFFLIFYLAFDSFAATVSWDDVSMASTYYAIDSNEFITLSADSFNTLYSYYGFDPNNLDYRNFIFGYPSPSGATAQSSAMAAHLQTIPISDTFNDLDGNSYDLSDAFTVICANGNGSVFDFLVLRVWGSSTIALCQNMLISDSPFLFAGYFLSANDDIVYMDFNWGSRPGSSSSGSNYNYLQLTSSYIGTRKVVFTDMPCYMKSFDGNSGLLDNADWDPANFENYLDFNTLRVDGTITRPSEVPPEPADNFAPIAKHYLTFNDSTNYVYSAYVGSNTPVTIVHKNDFRFNEQQILNPTYYNLRFSYVIAYQDSTMLNPEYFFYEVDGVQLALVLGQLNRLGGTHDVPIPFSDCLNVSGTRNLNQQLRLLEESITNTDYNYTNPWDIFTDLGNSVLGNSISVGSTFIPYIHKFEISGSVVIYDKNNPTYISGTHEDKEDFVNGEFTLVSNANTQNLYPIPEGTDLPPSVIDNQLPSNPSNNYNDSVAYGGNVVNNIYPATNYYKPFNLDDVTVAGVADQWNYIIRNMQDSDDENSFWGVIKGVYDYIPAPVWGWVLTAIGSVLGCAVFKFYISSIRI